MDCMLSMNLRNEDELMEDMAALELESGGGQTETVETPEPVQQPAGKKKTVRWSLTVTLN